ncbi:3-oxoacyl-[acyl-carrier-protein] synthase III C-terminal domain-containing protein [uncultured Shimia sp.]|uniref:hydroxymethylglutaryl-CoA synthase family protein n=1 Tax=uncultured Shimia sp. TaxID=573152 RepID=UPI0025E439A8|nr:3-oxoacyl-[acyl-carrier-protein] synthase III C-terminal domain-containing protein [uncultured Shimia sp.]
MQTGILAFGGYVPRARLQRQVIAAAHSWFTPALKGLGRGERAMANWNEDSITMAVEAGRDCLGGQGSSGLDAVIMGSTSYPFKDRQNAGVVADALTLGSDLMTLDIGGSQRAGTSALMAALQLGGSALVVSAEKRRTKPGNPLELTTGDAAAAFHVGQGDVVACYLGGASRAVDLVDHFRGENGEFDYTWEERWVRDEGYLKIVPDTVAKALQNAGVTIDQVSTFCFPVPSARIASAVARKVGLAPEALADNLQGSCGEAGASHPLVMLAHTLDNADPGDIILVVGFGQGSDALLFQVTDAIRGQQGKGGITGCLKQGYREENYHKFLAFNQLIEMEQGIRSEVDKNTGLTTLYRNKDMVQGLIGGRCTSCNTKQFPKSNICANPECGRFDSQVPEPFADKSAALNSFTGDGLTFSPNPPHYYGMVQFEGGGRLMSDITDVTPDAELKIGMSMRMVFRVKDYDHQRGFRRYFWIATPA